MPCLITRLSGISTIKIYISLFLFLYIAKTKPARSKAYTIMPLVSKSMSTNTARPPITAQSFAVLRLTKCEAILAGSTL